VEHDVIAGVPASRLYPNNDELKNDLIIAVTETSSEEDMEVLVAELQEVLNA
jgi:glycine dehydrogenase subunit 1